MTISSLVPYQPSAELTHLSPIGGLRSQRAALRYVREMETRQRLEVIDTLAGYERAELYIRSAQVLLRASLADVGDSPVEQYIVASTVADFHESNLARQARRFG
jgi:hypothetical protein